MRTHTRNFHERTTELPQTDRQSENKECIYSRKILCDGAIGLVTLVSRHVEAFLSSSTNHLSCRKESCVSDSKSCGRCICFLSTSCATL